MQAQPVNRPAQQRSPWFFVLWACGGCSCLGVILAVVGVSLLGVGFKKGMEGLAALAREAKADLKVKTHKMVQNSGERYIAGSLKNISPTHTYATADIEFEVFDKSGNPLPPVSTQTQDLKPGATWEFKAPILDPAVANYKFGEVTGFQEVAEDPTLDPALRQQRKEQQAAMNKFMQDMLKKTQEDAAKPGKP